MEQLPRRDVAFMESINQTMRIPERLSVGVVQQWGGGTGTEAGSHTEEPPPAYSMQVPDRLTYSEAPDMSPRPLLAVSRPPAFGPAALDACWDGASFSREGLQSPIRRSYSDQSFGRTPPGTPTHLKQALALPRHQSSSRESLHSGAPPSFHPSDPGAGAQTLSRIPASLLSPPNMLQAAQQLGKQACQRLLQAVSNKYRSGNQWDPPVTKAPPPASALMEPSKKRTMENWSPEEEGGAAVEFIILRRQVMKMSRRLAALERHSTERRNTEVLLFSLLLSACLLNAWLWIRK